MTDTSESIQDRYRTMLLGISAGERVAMACRMFSTARALVEAGIRQRDPQVNDRAKLRREVFLRFYRNDFTPEEAERILCKIADGDL